MNRWIQGSATRVREQEILRAQLDERIKNFNVSELQLMQRFASQIVSVFNPDVIEDFLRWENDPKLGTILELAASLSDEMRDQLLFKAEEYYTEDSPSNDPPGKQT